MYLFKEDLQKLASRQGIEIRVAHYPPYCSKYNPIEHRLFPHLTRACRGVIFHTLETVRYYMAKAESTTGMRVKVSILDKCRQAFRIRSATRHDLKKSSHVKPRFRVFGRCFPWPGRVPVAASRGRSAGK